MAKAALISVTPLLAPSLSMSWTSRTRISSLMRGPSFAAGCGVLMGRRMVLLSCVVATSLSHPYADHDGHASAMLIGEHGRSGVFGCKSTTMRHDPLRRSAFSDETWSHAPASAATDFGSIETV